MIDNGGGGIFSYLPPAELPEFEQLFVTPHGLDLVDVARSHGAIAERVDDMGKLGEVLAAPELVAPGAVRVLVVPVDRPASVARHRELWDAVEATLREAGTPTPGD